MPAQVAQQGDKPAGGVGCRLLDVSGQPANDHDRDCDPLACLGFRLIVSTFSFLVLWAGRCRILTGDRDSPKPTGAYGSHP